MEWKTSRRRTVQFLRIISSCTMQDLSLENFQYQIIAYL